MKIDNIQEIWQSESNNQDQPILNQLSASEKFQNPIRKIKRNMIFEFVCYLLSFFLILKVAARNEAFLNEKLSNYYIVFAVQGMVCLAFFYQFYLFYKTISKVQLTTLKNLIIFRYELKIALHIYRIYCYLFAIIALPTILVILFQIGQISFEINNIDIVKWLLSIAPSGILITFFFIFLFTELYLYTSYGIYIKRVDKILKEMEDQVDENV